MKMRTFVLAAAVLTTAGGVALAQTAGDPSTLPNQHQGAGASSDKMMKKGTTMKAAGSTTGSGMKSPAAQSQDKAVSPASPNAGVKQDK
jgi:hypothetical protein